MTVKIKYNLLNVEPCAGTDVPDTPTVGIAVEDTDGEWIEMKKKEATKKYKLARRNYNSYSTMCRLR